MKRATVAIVEDEFLVALQLEDILSDAGYEVIATASDLASAKAIARPVDVALVDLNLRDGLTGPQIARHLSDSLQARIIYVTANPAQIDLPAGTSIGVIQKPFSRRAVEGALAFAVDKTCTTERPYDLQLLDSHTFVRPV